MDLQDKCVPSTNNIHVPNKGLFVDISASDDNIQLKELVSSENELPIRIRKPYTITKQRERWTEEEHEKFLEALRLHGRAWRRIQEHIGTKTAIQIRSHAQKFFSKVDRDSGTEKAIEIPPPRPKRKPLHPYPRKLYRLCTTRVPDMKQPEQSSPISSLSEQESGSPVSVLSVVGSDTLGSPISKPSNSCASPLSPVVRSDPLVLSLSEPENGCCSPASSVVRDDRILSPSQASSALAKLDDTPMESKLGSRNWFSPIEGSPVGEQPSSLKLFGRTFFVTNSQNPCSSADGNVAQDFNSVPIADVGLHKERADTDMQNQASAFVHLPAHEDLCGTAGRIMSDGAAPSMYYFLVPDGIQMNSPDKKIAPVPFWQTSYGSLPLPFTEKLYMSSKQDRPQTSTEVTTQAIAGREVSFIGCSLGSAWNESIVDDSNHTVLGFEGSGSHKEPARAFKLKPSESSAFVTVKASNRKSARGLIPYEGCKV